jgi:hypothetical protein
MKHMKNVKRKCLTDEEIALFIDRGPDYEGYDRVIRHLSECSACLDKTVESTQLLRAEVHEPPQGLPEKAFGRARRALEGRSVRAFPPIRKALLPLALAASLLIIIMIGVNRVGDSQRDEVLISTVPERHERSLHREAERAPTAQRVIRHRRDQPLLRAGYVYFLLRNAESTDAKLLRELYASISITKLHPGESIQLIRERKFDLFQKKISALPEKERNDFSEGYILSMLYYSDDTGAVHDTTIEWGKKLVLNASMNEIRQCMLYRR